MSNFPNNLSTVNITRRKCRYCYNIISEANLDLSGEESRAFPREIWVVMGNDSPESAWLRKALAYKRIQQLEQDPSQSRNVRWHAHRVPLHDGKDFQFITLEVTLW